MKDKIVKTIPIILLIGYIVLGLFIYDDYGISTDEVTERRTTLINVKYIMNMVGYDGLSDMDDDLLEYKDRYYGVFLQMPCVIFEWLTGFKDSPAIYLYRHLYVFVICVVGYVCFYALCMRLTNKRLLSMIGTAMLALYPRFFANQFYDIKDMLFMVMCMISMWVTVETIYHKFSTKWLIFFALLTAITTNIRIVGIIFPVLMIGYILLTGLMNCFKINVEDKCLRPIKSSLLISVIFLGSYVAIMPSLWKNPIVGFFNVFSKFSKFDDWNGHVVFMGELVRGSEIPWWYIPIWMLVSVPIWYWLVLSVVLIILAGVFFKKIRNRKMDWELLFKYKYLIWSLLLAFVPWLGIVVFHSTLYNSWRHCFFLLPPIVLLLVYGLSLVDYKIKTNKFLKRSIMVTIIIGLINQSGWIIENHPYQMVYLNPIGRVWGNQFDRDYWCLATTDMCKWVLANDSSEKISINAPFNNFERLLDEDEKKRIVIEDDATYWLESYRKIIGDTYVKEGYEEIYAIVVDGYKIGSVQKKIG